jgi:hypothetical protein
MNFPHSGETAVSEQRIVGVIEMIQGAFRGALDGTPARVMQTTDSGYIVELLKANRMFMKGDQVYIGNQDFSPLRASRQATGFRGVGFTLIEEPAVLDALRQKFLREWAIAA